VALIQVFKDVFGNEEPIPDGQYLGQLLAKPDFGAFVAKEGPKVVGGLTLYVLHGYYTPKPTAYLYDLGILPAYQRQGIGTALIRSVCDYCRTNGFESAYVEAEYDDHEAVSFYRQTPFASELQAVHFTYSFATGD
jgi:aminoglycoside 3-N-acetyltransferase I